MVLDDAVYTGTVLVAVILASAARTIIPWLAKRQDDITAGLEPRPFSLAYVMTAAIGAVPVLVGAILILPTVLPQIQNNGTQLMVFITGFGLAYAATDLVNRNISAPSVPLSQVAKVNAIRAKQAAEEAGRGNTSSTSTTSPTTETTTKHNLNKI